jgi:cystathionine beta-lyase
MSPDPFRSLTTPIHRASTLVFDDTAAFLERKTRLFEGYSYGLYGTPTTRMLEERVAAIEGGRRTVLVPSGLAALTHALLAMLASGDHVIVADCVYAPTREFCRSVLAAMGIEASFVGSGADSIADALRPTTRVVVLESPGSFSMEIQDIERICAQAHEAGCRVLLDNTWGFGASRMFEHGVDVVCSALSKYAGGHSDVCLGAITVQEESLFRTIKTLTAAIGSGVSSDDAYLVLRGLESLQVRVAEHARRGLAVSEWFAGQPGVARVLNPAAPTDPYHSRFGRYFSSGNGLLSVVMQEASLRALSAMLDNFQHFRLGASWGGTHSLVSITDLAPVRTAAPWPNDGYVLRFHIGLEPLDALFDDLRAGLDRLAHARQIA